MSVAVDFKNVDIVFGKDIPGTLRLIDAGANRAEILAKTGAVLGAAGANLTVNEGEISVLMGLSGSGKSTVLRAVNGLNKVARGQVLVKDGERMVDVVSCDADTLRHMRQKQVAMVFQQFALLPWRTVRENAGLGLELAGIQGAEYDERVDKQLKLVGLDTWSNKYVHELSGGMQQRVGLARAFATDAPILLMDEPFSALDPLIRTKLQDELIQLQKSIKKTIHRQREPTLRADRVERHARRPRPRTSRRRLGVARFAQDDEVQDRRRRQGRGSRVQWQEGRMGDLR
jgi:glycine betaine/proline transport system ATP-binding protein